MLDNVWHPTAVLLVAYAVVVDNFGLSIPFKEFERNQKLVKNATQTDWSLDSIKGWNWRKRKSGLEDEKLNKIHYYKPQYKLTLQMPWKLWNNQKHFGHHSDANFWETNGYRKQQLQKQLNRPPAFTENGLHQNPIEFLRSRRKYKITTPGYYYRWSHEKASHYEYERSLSIYEDVNDTIDFEYEVKSYERWYNYPLTTPSYPNPGWHLPTIQKYYEKPYRRAKREAKHVIFWSKRRKEIEKKRIKKRMKEWRKKRRELKARGLYKKKKGDGSYRGGRGRRPRSHIKPPPLNYTITPKVKRKKEDKQKGEIKENATNKTLEDEEYEEVEEEVTYEEYDDDEDGDSNDISKTVKRVKGKKEYRLHT